MSLKQLPVVYRLALIVALACVGCLSLATFALLQFRGQVEENYQRKVRSLVETAYSVLQHYQQQESAGAMTRAAAQAAARETLRTARYDGTEYFYLWDSQGNGVLHPFRPDFEGKNMIGQIFYGDRQDLIANVVNAVRSQPTAFLETAFPRPGTSEAVPKLQYLMKFEAWDWVVGSGIYTDDIDTIFMGYFRNFTLIVLAIVGVLMVVAWRVVRSVTGQLGGEPAYANQIMHRAAEGDLSVRVAAAREADSLLATLAQMLQRLRGMMSEVGVNAEQVAGNTRDIAEVSRRVASASHLQSDATSEIAAAVEQMTVSINHIADSARDTEQNSSQTVKLAEQGEQRADRAAEEMNAIATTVGEATQRIEALVNRADEIGSIANVIKEIAAQTNLLALNAAIEAARAGEQGRGFAVVADEVRGLAERTAEATVRIEQMIGGIQSDTHGAVEEMSRVSGKVRQGVGLVHSAAESLRDIHHGSGAALARIRDVADATKEQSTVAVSIAQRVEQIAKSADETNASMQSVVGAVQSLEQLATELHGLVGRFRY